MSYIGYMVTWAGWLGFGFRPSGFFRISTLILLQAFFGSFTAPAAPITWCPAAPITDETDVCTAWTLDRAYNLGAAKTRTNVTVNGVPFKPWGSGVQTNTGPERIANADTVLAVSGDGDGINSADGLFAPTSANLSPRYQQLLQSGAWNNGSVWALILNGLTVSNTYLLQVWVNDSRVTNLAETLSGGTNVSPPLRFNSTGKAGALGQHLVGIFTADSPSQAITFQPSGGPALLNAFQLRVASSNPPPAIIKPPLSLTNQTGARAELAVVAWGEAPLTYRWQKMVPNRSGGPAKTQDIAGATNAFLSFAALAATDGGDYRVVLASTSGCVTSALASVTLVPTRSWVWTGKANGTWDFRRTANWSTNGLATTYVDGVLARFDDTAEVTTVSNAVTVLPFAITVSNNQKNFILGGEPIGGNARLTKSGIGTLTLTGTNTYAGGTSIEEGIISVSADYQLGSGSLTLSGGMLAIAQGRILHGGNSAERGGDSLSPHLQARTTGDKLSPPTNTKRDALLVATVFSSAREVVLGTNSGTIQVDNAAGATLTGRFTGPGRLTKSGSGTLTLSGANTHAGGTVVNGGKLLATGGGWYVNRSVGAGRLTINPGATVEFTKAHGFGVALDGRSVTINGGTLQLDGDNYASDILMSGGTINVAAGHYLALAAGTTCKVNPAPTAAVLKADTVKVMGLVTFDIARGNAADDFKLAGSCTGLGAATNAGSIIKTGDGILVLAGTNSFAGSTTVSNGTLRLEGPLAGPLTVRPNASLALGRQEVGTLTLTNRLVLEGNITFRLRKSGGVAASDRLNGLTSVSYGGTLTVTNLTDNATPLAVGDSFTLIDATTRNGSFANVVLPALSANLKWDISGLAASGTIKVTSAAP